MELAVTVRGLRKSYGDLKVLRGIDLQVRKGEIFALLGPNGAGKTTLVEILEGFRPRDSGAVDVLGVDPAQKSRHWHSRIGVVLQSSQMEPELTVSESLRMFAGYFSSPLDVDETIDMLGLTTQRHTRAGRLSGGQQRRLDVAIALIGDPELLFLDEPTTGFDAAARRHAWDVIANLRNLGKTVLLTTHYMDEAQMLADRVAVISGGVIAVEGQPDALVRGSETRITFTLPDGLSVADLPAGLGDVAVRGARVRITTASPVAALNALTSWALRCAAELPDLEATRPSLEEIYLQITGTAGDG